MIIRKRRIVILLLLFLGIFYNFYAYSNLMFDNLCFDQRGTDNSDLQFSSTQREFNIIADPPDSQDWNPISNPSLPVQPDDYGIDSEGCYVSHYWDEGINASRNLPSIRWEKNCYLEENMSDWIITSASVSAIVNATVHANNGLSAGVDCPGDSTDQGAMFDFVEFYILISDGGLVNEFEIAYLRTTDLGNDSAGEYDVLLDTSLDTVSEAALIIYLNKVLNTDNHNFTVIMGIDIYCENNYILNDTDYWDMLRIKSFNLTFTYKFREWIFNGVDTQRIPEFSVYPSERYIYNNTHLGIQYNHSIYEVVKANTSDTFLGNPKYLPFYQNFTYGTCIYINQYYWNASLPEEWLYLEEWQAFYWNGTTYLGIGTFIPIDENTGGVNEYTLGNFSYFMELSFSQVKVTFENTAIYPNSFSIQLWNSSYNNAYFRVNFTEKGILTKMEGYLIFNMFNMTLYSKPAQLPPNFSLTTETGSLTVDTTEFKLNLTINDVDNNNDGLIDSDYLYRIFTGTGWTAWAPIPSQIDFDLGQDAIEAGYAIMVEVKNMYGVTQEQILVNYNLPDGSSETISGYPALLIGIFAMLGISVITYTYQNKSKLKI